MLIGPSVFNFRILREYPNSLQECAWREFLSRSDWASHYTAPEYFLEPFWSGKRPFAVLVSNGDKIVALLTGCHQGNTTFSGVPGVHRYVLIVRQTTLALRALWSVGY
jgi:hypothetical protein